MQKPPLARRMFALVNKCLACGVKLCVIGGVQPSEPNEDVDERLLLSSVAEAVFAGAEGGNDWGKGLDCKGDKD